MMDPTFLLPGRPQDLVRSLMGKAHSLEVLSERSHGMRLAGFLQKPFDLATLGVRVSKVLVS
jgi:hypothetical protein